MNLQIESIDPCSAEAAALIRDLKAELLSRYGFVDGAGEYRPGDGFLPKSVFLIGRSEGEPVACGALRPLESAICEMKRMYVVPGCRNRGFAGAILAELERRASDFGYTVARLETGIHQPEAVRVYERAGYRMIPRFGPYVADERSVCFEKKL